MRLLRVVVLLSVLSPLVVISAPDRTRFERKCEVQGSFTTGQRGRLVVPNEVFGVAHAYPNDLRLIGEDGTTWPFFACSPAVEVDTKRVSLKILNQSFVQGETPYMQFDLLIPPKGGAPMMHRQLELQTTGSDFIRRVEVSIETPKSPLRRLATGYLIHVSRPHVVQNRTIRYPESDVARLQVRIYCNAQSNEDPFELISAELSFSPAEKSLMQETIPFIEMTVPGRDAVAEAQTYLLDLGVTTRPVEIIHFEVKTPSFVRNVWVYGRNNDRDPWRRVGGGEIHALEGDVTDTVTLKALDRFLKVQIFHYDDPPLEIDALRLKAVSRYLVFEAASSGHATLYYRALNLPFPRYDLRQRMKGVSLDDLPLFSTSAGTDNPEVRSAPWRDASGTIGIIAVGSVSLLVIWIIVRMMRKGIPTDEG